jgi:hypothetical protein
MQGVIAGGLKSQIIQIRRTIRDHRDAKGDDRCWLDDYLVWNLLPREEIPIPKLNTETGMFKCIEFYVHRRSDTIELVPSTAILDPTKWNEDLESKCEKQLWDVVGLHLLAVEEHYHSSLVRSLTIDDDRKLYATLPEKIPADFRLPRMNEFLGKDKPHAGCPNFWDSHRDCAEYCNLHQWGPCV